MKAEIYTNPKVESAFTASSTTSHCKSFLEVIVRVVEDMKYEVAMPYPYPERIILAGKECFADIIDTKLNGILPDMRGTYDLYGRDYETLTLSLKTKGRERESTLVLAATPEKANDVTLILKDLGYVIKKIK